MNDENLSPGGFIGNKGGTGRPSNKARAEMRHRLTPERIDKIARIIDEGEVSQQLQAFSVLCNVGIAKSIEVATTTNEELLARVFEALAEAVPDADEYDRISAIITERVTSE